MSSVCFSSTLIVFSKLEAVFVLPFGFCREAGTALGASMGQRGGQDQVGESQELCRLKTCGYFFTYVVFTDAFVEPILAPSRAVIRAIVFGLYWS